MSPMHARRGDFEHDEGPPNGTRYPCPVDDCGWYLDLDSSGFAAGGHVPGPGVGDVERTLQAHLDGHTVVEFVATITRLRHALGERVQ